MKKILTIGISLLLVLTLTGCSETDNTDKKEEEQVQTKPEDSKKEFFFDGETAELEDITIRITQTKILQPGEEGNEYGDVPLIAFWYDTTNKSDKEIDPMSAWLSVFEAYQDNNENFENKLSVGTLPDSSHRESQMYNIKKNGTLENSMSYELTDEVTPVTLVASKGIFGDELGRFDFTIE